MTINEKSLENLKPFTKGGENPNQAQNLPGSNNAWSIRNKLRHLATQELDPSDPEAMKKCITRDGTKHPTVAETIAAAILTRASSGNIKAATAAMDNIEGKLPQTYNDETLRPALEKPEFHIHIRPKDDKPAGA